MDAVANIARIDNLPSLIARARTLFDQGDFAAAKVLASGAYEQAKAELRFAEKMKAAERLRDKARSAQSDALRIESLCKMEIALQWDAAQQQGHASTGGRPPKDAPQPAAKTVPHENGSAAIRSKPFTAEEAGISRREIHEGRLLAQAERKNPGIVERAIAARLDARLEPSRRNLNENLRAAVGTATATKEERGFQLYETPVEAMHALLALETFSPTIWEPACGKGAILRQLEAAGYDVVISDLVDYGTADSMGTVQDVGDFLASSHAPDCRPDSCPDIVTNPPYGGVLNAFVAHALRQHKPKKMALLLNLNFFCGFEDLDRRFARDENKPARVHIFTRRLPMMHRDGWDGPEASSRMNTAWFVWERDAHGRYPGPTIANCVDWADFVPKEGSAE